ncbi:ArsR/SmtB family transcription factor [Lacisediminihabitans profunda]|uniref:ArsR/SmtB family transcription factor n=1 Tax=Lacisediminihabitans profunda TaxID=2594790 RepID=UPI001FEB00DB|nr:helix-turn-helix domain-containing protein [Lacisediminihabitans profunda]
MESEVLEHPSVEEIDLVEVLKALSDPARLRLLAVMGDGDYHACRAEVYDLDLHKSTLSHHFKVMREAGVTMTRVTGRNRETRLRKEDLDARFPGLVDSLISGVTKEQTT